MQKVRILAVGGADVNLGDYDKRTAIHLAASEGARHIVTELIERKADIIRMAAAVPPQNQNAKRQAGEIMSLVEQAKKWVC